MADIDFYRGDTSTNRGGESLAFSYDIESLEISSKLRGILRLPPNKQKLYCHKVPEGTEDGCAVFVDDLSTLDTDMYWTEGLYGCYGMSLLGFNWYSRTWRFIFAHNRGWDTDASWNSKQRLNGRIAAFCERLDRICVEGCQSMRDSGDASQVFNKRMSISTSITHLSSEYTYFPRLALGFRGKPKEALEFLESLSSREIIDNALLSLARLEPPIYRALYNTEPQINAARNLITKNPSLKEGLAELRERKKNELSKSLFSRSLTDLSGHRKQQKIDFLDAVHNAAERGDLHAMEAAFDILGAHTDESHDTYNFASQLRNKVATAKTALAVADAQAHATIQAEHQRLSAVRRPAQRHCTFLYEGLRNLFIG